MTTSHPIRVLKYATAVDWAAETEPLVAGELGFDTTNRLLRVGDGTTLWPALPDLVIEGDSALLASHVALLAAHIAALDAHEILLGEHEDLLEEHADLMAGHTTLLAEHDTLMDTHAGLLSGLQTELDAAEAEIDGILPITYGDLSSGLYPIRPVAALPTLPDALYPEGAVVFLTTTDKLYRSTGSTWITSVATTDLTGTITTTQITDDAITTPKIAANAVTANEITAGTITATELATNSVIADKILAGAISAAKIATGAVEADKIASNAVTTLKLNAEAVTSAKIAAGTIVASNIAASTITGDRLAAGTITSDRIAAGTITGDRIAATTITGDRIAGTTITGSKIAAGTITATNIAAGTITATELAADSVSASELAAIVMGVGKYIQSTSFSTGTTGWKINASGSAEFNNVTVRGSVTADDGTDTSTFNADGVRLPVLTTSSSGGDTLLNTLRWKNVAASTLAKIHAWVQAGGGLEKYMNIELIGTGGVMSLIADGSVVIDSAILEVPDGTASNPGITFAGDANTGLQYNSSLAGSGVKGIGLVVDGANVLTAHTGGEVRMPAHGTTANAANANIAAATGVIARSTSSHKVKKAVKPLRAVDTLRRLTDAATTFEAVNDETMAEAARRGIDPKTLAARTGGWMPRRAGFIAERVAEADETLAQYDEHGDPIYFNVDGIVAHLVDGWRHHEETIAALVKRIDHLEDRLAKTS